MNIFVELVGSIPSSALVFELITLVSSFPMKNPLQPPLI